MALIELYCPHCGGDVQMDQSMMFGVCQNCGSKCMLQEMVPKKMEVTIKNADAPDVDNLIQLALNLWIADDPSAIKYVNKAMPLAPNDLRIWILKSVIEESDVSAIIGSATINPAKDVDFCLKVINKDSIIIDLIQDRIDHPIIHAIAEVEEAMTRLDRHNNLIATIYIDELDTGYEREKNTIIALSEHIDEYVNLICSNPLLSEYAKIVQDSGIARKIKDMANIMATYPAVDSQTISIAYLGKLLIGKSYHSYPGGYDTLRFKRIVQEMNVCVGAHKFVDSSYEGSVILLIPKMPKQDLINAGDYGPFPESTLVHTYRLAKGLFINVDTRDHGCPAMITDAGYAINYHVQKSGFYNHLLE